MERGPGGVTGLGLVQIRYILHQGHAFPEIAAPTTHTPKIIKHFLLLQVIFPQLTEKMITWNATNDRKLLLAVLKVSSHGFRI